MITPTIQQQQETFSNQKTQNTCSSCPVVLIIVLTQPLLQYCLTSKAFKAGPLPIPMPYMCVKTVVYKIFYVRKT